MGAGIQDPLGSTSEAGEHVTYTVLALLYMLLIGVFFGSRIHFLSSPKVIKRLNLVQVLVLIAYLIGILFILIAAVLINGLDVSTQRSCKAVIYVCLTFYFSIKFTVQLFLVERAHAVRYHLKRRLDDWIWVGSVTIMVIGFTSIAVVSFIYPLGRLEDNGVCHVGLPLKVSAPLLSLDIAINAGLTAIFVILLRPLLRLQHSQLSPQNTNPDWGSANDPTPKFTTRIWSSQKSEAGSTASSGSERGPNELESLPRTIVSEVKIRALRNLVYRSLVGTFLILLPTIINMGLFFKYIGQERGWFCLVLCTTDATFSITVVHWLTANKREDELFD